MPIADEKWYTRPVFSVSDMDSALHHYCELLSFKQIWKHEEGDKILVAQVSRGDCEVILAGNLDRVGMGRILISLSESEMSSLTKEIEEKNIPIEKIHWGYPTLRIQDPDGNEILLPQESEDS